MLLKLDFKDIYRSDRNDIVKDFYIPALKKAKIYKRSVAYFTSSALFEISKGLDEMIYNGGTFQLIVSPRLSDDDLDAIRKGYSLRSIIDNSLADMEILPCNAFEEERLNYLATLIGENRLDIKVVFLVNDLGYGVYHEKIGVIEDPFYNIIAFSGSTNETYNAQRINFESFHVFRNWGDESEKRRVKETVLDFDNLWNDNTHGVRVFEIPEAFKKKLLSFKKESVIRETDLEKYKNQSDEGVQSVGCILKVYKGFDSGFLNCIKAEPLVEEPVENKTNVFCMNEEYLRKMISAIALFRNGERWITYEEFSRLYEEGIQLLKAMSISVVVETNNIYPDVYPLKINYDKNQILRYLNLQENYDEENNIPEDFDIFRKCYSEIIEYRDNFYIKYKNYEFADEDIIRFEHFPINKTYILESGFPNVVFEITDNELSYIQIVEYTLNNRKTNIGVISRTRSKKVSTFIKSLYALIEYRSNDNRFFEAKDDIIKKEVREDFIRIAKEVVKIPGFKSFNELDIYENPYEGNEIQKISQGEIIETIVLQAEKAFQITGAFYHDVFVTAPTGAGKSVIFQIPAIYLAEKYGKLTIVISPLVELMNDQVLNLKKRGYTKAARLNSDLNVTERESVLEDIKSGNIDILYLGPETLLSYSIESIIGEREIGLVIIDEAHIVTSWGQGFRPDYWYLGNYINRARKSTDSRGFANKKKAHSFPICAFTATAVCGGIYDTIRETEISLYMNAPIKYIGRVKRGDIEFEIQYDSRKLNHSQYEDEKQKLFSDRIHYFHTRGEKTLAYFPYDSYAKAAKEGRDGFQTLKGITEFIGIYTGKTNKDEKKLYAREYRKNQIKIMLATKAFGMGIDIDDIQNVYHYAPTGNLNDYVQEIGRAARKKDLIGKAITDFFDKDMNFIKKLFGMSAIREYHIKRSLSVIYDAYEAKKKQRFLITPKMFAHIFQDDQDDSQLENKVKTTLLTIEKDLEQTFKFKVLLSRPKSMFTQTFVVISNEAKETVLRSKYGEFFSWIEDGRNGHREYANCFVTDLGDVYRADLKGLWENFYPNKSFADFKRCFYMKEEKTVLNDIKEHIFPRVKLEIEVKIDKTFADMKNEALATIDDISNVLLELKQENKFFSKEGKGGFADKLEKLWGNRLKAASVANAYMEMITDGDRRFYTARDDRGEQVYYIDNSIFRSQAERIIHQSKFIKNNFTNCTENKLTLFLGCNDESSKKDIKVLSLLMLLDLIHYNISGGDNPEIYVFLSDPYKIKSIINGRVKYENDLVKEAKRKHESDIKIMTFFFTKLKNNEERWRFIEDYYLGKDLHDEYHF